MAISRELTKIHPPLAILLNAVLLNAVKDETGGIRKVVASLLGKTGNKQAIKTLIDLLGDSGSDVRISAVGVLMQLEKTEAVTPLLALLDDSDSDVRSNVALALGKLGSTKSVRPLLTLLKDPVWQVRHRAAEALGRLRSSEAAVPLIALLKDSYSYVRRSAVEALGQLGSSKAVAPLLALFKDSEPDIRRSAAEALGKLRSSEAVAPLIVLLNDLDHDVRNNAASALAQIGNPEAVSPLLTMLISSDKEDCFCVAEALGRLGNAKAVAPLLALLTDSKPWIRGGAALALGRWGNTSAVAPLITLLHDSDSDVRGKAAEALGRLESSQAVPPLLELLKNSNSDVRRSVAEALWYLGNPQGIKPFYVEEDELPPATKKSVEPLKANILQQINSGQTSSVLSKLGEIYSRLKEDNIHIQRAVVAALGEILKADKNSTPLSPQAEVATPATVSNTLVTLPVAIKPPLSSKSLPDYKVNIQAKLGTIISDSNAMFGLRRDALKAITALGTEEVVQIIRESIAQEKIGDKDNSLVFAAFQALGDNGHLAAVPFLQDQLHNLTQRKQAWRDRRDKKTGITTTTSLACETSQTHSPTAEDSTWQQESWEYELGYALARLDLKVGIALLKHSLRKVREGAQEGLATVATGEGVATLIGQREKITQAGIGWVDEAIFVQAAYRAIDKMLITLEETGTGEDLKALQGLKEVKDEAVKARVEWTVGVVGDRVGQ